MRPLLCMLLAACVLALTVSDASAARRGRGRVRGRVARRVVRAALAPVRTVRALRRVAIGNTGTVIVSGQTVLTTSQIVALRGLPIVQRRAVLVQAFGPVAGVQLLSSCQ